MLRYGILSILTGLSVCTQVFAADQVIKESTRPPEPYGAITVEQIPPLNALDKPTQPAPTPNIVQPSPSTVMPITDPTPPQQPIQPTDPMTNTENLPTVESPTDSAPMDQLKTETKPADPFNQAFNDTHYMEDDGEGIITP